MLLSFQVQANNPEIASTAVFRNPFSFFIKSFYAPKGFPRSLLSLTVPEPLIPCSVRLFIKSMLVNELSKKTETPECIFSKRFKTTSVPSRKSFGLGCALAPCYTKNL